MLGVLTSESAAEGYQDQWHDHRGEEGMTGEQGKVHRPTPALSGKMMYSDVSMVVEITEQKDHRSTKGGDHGSLVCFDLVARYKAFSRYQQHGSGPVQGCINSREIRESGRLHEIIPLGCRLSAAPVRHHKGQSK